MAEQNHTTALIVSLREAAEEIAEEGHDGWGNLCSEAADVIDMLRRQQDVEREQIAWLQSELAATRIRETRTKAELATTKFALDQAKVLQAQ